MSRRPWKQGVPVAPAPSAVVDPIIAIWGKHQPPVVEPSPSATEVAPQLEADVPVYEETPAPVAQASAPPSGLVSCHVHEHGALHHNGVVYAPGTLCELPEHVIVGAAGALIRTE